MGEAVFVGLQVILRAGRLNLELFSSEVQSANPDQLVEVSLLLHDDVRKPER